MLNCYILALAGIAANVNALPLNINLGAYSPALVVGDGEISFGGQNDVAGLMNALEGAAVNNAAGTGTRAGGTVAGGAAAGGAVAAAGTVPVATSTAVAGGKPAAASIASTPTTSAAASSVDASSVADTQLEEDAANIQTLQGMGKEIAPREGEEAPKAKRDIAGFDRALQYAENALVKGPTVQLGTGKEGSGVGVIVDNRPAAQRTGALPAAGIVAAPAAPVPGTPATGVVIGRDETSAASQSRRRTKVTTMYVRRGVPASLQSSENIVARDVQSLPVVAAPAKVAKRDSATAIDAVNLNVEGSEGFTMTFVETADDEDEE